MPRPSRAAILVLSAMTAGACLGPAPSVAPSLRVSAPPTLAPPPDVVGLGWTSVLDVERPPDAFELPTDPRSDPNTAGHPLHFPGQATIEDVVATPAGLVGVGYVGFEWRPVAWHADDPHRWQLTEIGRVRPDDAAFAMAAVAAPDGEVISVGRAGRRPAVWRSHDAGVTWRHVQPPILGAADDWERMTAIATDGGQFVAGGSVGPELLERRTRFWTSSDGDSWQPVPDDEQEFESAEVVEILALPGGRWLALGRLGDGQRTTGSLMWSSPDGRTWTRSEPEVFADARIRGATVREDGSVVVVGSTIDETMALSWTSRDVGATWERSPRRESLIYGDDWKVLMTDVVEVDGELVAVGNVVPLQHGQGMGWRSADGLFWTRSPVQPPLGNAEPMAAVAVEGRVVAVGTAGSPDNFIPRVWLSPPG